MRLFTFGRAVRLAMLGGAIYYVRKHGGVRATWDHLSEKVKPLAEQAKGKMSEVAQNLGQTSQKFGQQDVPPTEAAEVVSTQEEFGTTGSGIPDFGNKPRY